MKKKFVLGILFSLIFLFSYSYSFSKDLKIAILDMDKAVSSYYKKDVEEAKVLKIKNEESEKISKIQKVVEQMKKDLISYGKTINDTSLSNSKRKEANNKYVPLQKEYRNKVSTLSSLLNSAEKKIVDARLKIYKILGDEVKEAAKKVSQKPENKFDLVLDKSFLPRSSKVIIYASNNISDITDIVIDEINKSKPKNKLKGK